MKGRPILGLTEEVTIVGAHQEKKVRARIDTGATASSIDMNLAAELGLGPVVRSRLIKSTHGTRRRPVVKAKIKLKEATIEEEFNLADRANMTYALLLGQNILKHGRFLIDPTKP